MVIPTIRLNDTILLLPAGNGFIKMPSIKENHYFRLIGVLCSTLAFGEYGNTKIALSFNSIVINNSLHLNCVSLSIEFDLLGPHSGKGKQVRPKYWVGPQWGWVKLNTDVALPSTNLNAGGGTCSPNTRFIMHAEK